MRQHFSAEISKNNTFTCQYSQYPESSVNNKIKGITAEDNKDAKLGFVFLGFVLST